MILPNIKRNMYVTKLLIAKFYSCLHYSSHVLIYNMLLVSSLLILQCPIPQSPSPFLSSGSPAFWLLRRKGLPRRKSIKTLIISQSPKYPESTRTYPFNHIRLHGYLKIDQWQGYPTYLRINGWGRLQQHHLHEFSPWTSILGCKPELRRFQ